VKHVAKSHLKLVTPTTEKRTVTPKRRPNADLRTREYLTEAEVERLLKATKGNRWAHLRAIRSYFSARGHESVRCQSSRFFAYARQISLIQVGAAPSRKSPRNSRPCLVSIPRASATNRPIWLSLGFAPP
jgi:hypothetical protein